MNTADKATVLERLKWKFRRFLLPVPLPARKHIAMTDYGHIGIAGLFRTGSGIGQAARNCYFGLSDSGQDVTAIDFSSKFNQVDLSFDQAVPYDDNPSWDTAIVFLNAPEFESVMFELRNGFESKSGKMPYIIGAWAWEAQVFPDGWGEALKWVSELWVPSAFVRDAFIGAVDLPIKVVPHYVPEVPSAFETDRTKNCSFQCIVMADGRSSFHRKNVQGAISAFQTAFTNDHDCKLLIKIRNLSEFPEEFDMIDAQLVQDARLELVDACLSPEETNSLLRGCDALISLHRSEGFGLHIAEAMLHGTPVVATGWSGNMEFMTAENAYLVDYTLEPIDRRDAIYGAVEGALWAKPNINAAAAHLRAIRTDPELATTKCSRAKADLRKILGPRVYQDAMLHD